MSSIEHAGRPLDLQARRRRRPARRVRRWPGRGRAAPQAVPVQLDRTKFDQVAPPPPRQRPEVHRGEVRCSVVDQDEAVEVAVDDSGPGHLLRRPSAAVRALPPARRLRRPVRTAAPASASTSAGGSSRPWAARSGARAASASAAASSSPLPEGAARGGRHRTAPRGSRPRTSSYVGEHAAGGSPPAADRVRPPGRAGPCAGEHARRLPRWRCGSAPPAWRATCGSPPTASPCSTTTGSSGLGCAGGRSPTSTGSALPGHDPDARGALRRLRHRLRAVSLDVKDRRRPRRR